MRILLDENIPRKLRGHFGTDHAVTTVPDMGWAGIKNGALIKLMQGQFEVFVTADQNMQYQQNFQKVGFIVVVLKAYKNKLELLLPLMPAVRAKLGELQPGDIATFE